MARKTTKTPVTKAKEPTAVPAPQEVAAQFKKPDLFEQTVARSSLKKRDVKPAVEAALAVIAEALIRGDDLNLQPLGKVRVVKAKDNGDGSQILTLKLRTPKNAALAADTGLAEDGDEG